MVDWKRDGPVRADKKHKRNKNEQRRKLYSGIKEQSFLLFVYKKWIKIQGDSMR